MSEFTDPFALIHYLLTCLSVREWPVNIQKCERCFKWNARFHVLKDRRGRSAGSAVEHVRVCCECLVPPEKAEIDAANRALKEAKLEPRDIVAGAGANI